MCDRKIARTGEQREAKTLIDFDGHHERCASACRGCRTSKAPRIDRNIRRSVDDVVRTEHERTAAFVAEPEACEFHMYAFAEEVTVAAIESIGGSECKKLVAADCAHRCVTNSELAI